MSPSLRAKDVVLVLGLVLIVLVLYLGFSSWGLPTTVVGLAVFLLLLDERRRAQSRHREICGTVDDTYSQIDALLSVRSELDVDAAFPATRGWAASPDFLRELVRLIRNHRPDRIVEAGSGVSTVTMALALKKYGGGQVIALENGEDFARETREYLQLHGVSDYAKVAHAPLREYTIDGAKHDWYEMAAVREFEPIDLIVVDGPPALAEPRARWPVLPLLQNQLADTARILLDDGDREGERRIVSNWCQDYELVATHIELEEGAYLLEKERS